MKTQDEYEDEFGKPDPVPAAKDMAADDDFEFAPKEEAKPVAAPEPVAPAKPQSFKEAFRAARAENLKNGTNKPFTWHGKPGVKFSTALDTDPKKAAKPASKPATSVAASAPAAAPAAAPAVNTVRGGSYAKGDPLHDNKPAAVVSPAKIEAAQEKGTELRRKISNDFDNTPLSRGVKAVGEFFTAPAKTAKSSSPMRHG